MEKKFYPGFSLIELIVVIALSTVLASISWPLYQNFQHHQALITTSQEIVATLRFAQRCAVTGEHNSHWGVYFSPEPTKTFTLYSGLNYNLRTTAWDEVHEFSAVVSVSEDLDINFNQQGMIATDATVVITNPENQQKIVHISSTGTIEEQ